MDLEEQWVIIQGKRASWALTVTERRFLRVLWARNPVRCQSLNLKFPGAPIFIFKTDLGTFSQFGLLSPPVHFHTQLTFLPPPLVPAIPLLTLNLVVYNWNLTFSYFRVRWPPPLHLIGINWFGKCFPHFATVELRELHPILKWINSGEKSFT